MKNECPNLPSGYFQHILFVIFFVNFLIVGCSADKQTAQNSEEATQTTEIAKPVNCRCDDFLAIAPREFNTIEETPAGQLTGKVQLAEGKMLYLFCEYIKQKQVPFDLPCDCRADDLVQDATNTYGGYFFTVSCYEKDHTIGCIMNDVASNNLTSDEAVDYVKLENEIYH
jgi:hypothetical protein